MVTITRVRTANGRPDVERLDTGSMETGRQVRSDALPEHQEYRDEGCDLFASCLECPLQRCRYDVPGGVRALLNRERDHQIRVMRDTSGLCVDEIAARFRVSRRTVFRALQLRGACGASDVPRAAIETTEATERNDR